MAKTALAIALALGLGIAGSPAAGADVASRLDPALAAALVSLEPGAQLDVNVLLRAADALPAPGPQRLARVAALQDRLLAALPADSFQVTRRYRSLAGFAGRADSAGVAALVARPEVSRVYLDGRVEASLVQGRGLIGAGSAHAQGYTGSGVKVAVIDTGVDSDHPDLQDDLVAEHCFCAGGLFSGCCPDGSDEDTSAEDDQGHGTAVSGIVTSGGVQAPLGVAPDALLVGVKVLDSAGSGSFSDTAAALDWLLTESATPGSPVEGLDVVNLSLGDGAEYAASSEGSCDASLTATAIAELFAAGVAVFVASGNEGHDGGVSFPACVAEAISVGGVYDASLGSVSWCGETPLCLPPPLCTDSSTAADDFVCHSNSGTLLDLLAPDYQTATSGLGGGVESSFGGTSAASPYAAAEAAVLLEADPSLTPGQLLAVLVASGPLVTNPDNGQSYSRSDLEEALESLPEPGTVAGLVAASLLLAALPRRRRSARTS